MFAHIALQPASEQLLNQLKETDEVGFPRPVRANQYVQRCQFKITLLNGFEAVQLQPGELVLIHDYGRRWRTACLSANIKSWSLM